MNDKDSKRIQILDAVVEACTMNDVDGIVITREDVLGRSRTANIHMTRCIYVSELLFNGYTTASVAAILHRTQPAIRHILKAAHQYRITNRAYRAAEAQATIKCNALFEEKQKENN